LGISVYLGGCGKWDKEEGTLSVLHTIGSSADVPSNGVFSETAVTGLWSLPFCEGDGALILSLGRENFNRDSNQERKKCNQKMRALLF
jgi:hypothetical protein